MTTVAHNVVAKLSVAFVAVAMLFTLVTPAKAATAEEMQDMINSLLAQVAALQGQMGTSNTAAGIHSMCPYTWTRSLTAGATGGDVMKLQQFLNSDADTRVSASGVGSVGMETEYYGPATAAAVSKFQVKHGVAAVGTGTFGPLSMAKANALCVVASDDSSDDDSTDDDSDDSTDDSDDSSDLGSDEGSIDGANGVSADESSLEEGQEGGVLAFDLEIEGDVQVDRIDVYAQEDGSASDDAEDYFVRAFLTVDGEEVASMDVEDWDQDDYSVIGSDDYRIRFSGLDLVFADGDEPEFQVGFEILGSLDSADLATDWDVEAEDVRYVDGKGFTDTFTVGEDETFGFDAEEIAELSIAKSSDSKDGTTLEVDTDDTSESTAIFTFEIEEENDVDLTVDEITMTASTTNGDVTTTIDEVVLFVDGEEVGSDSPAANGALVFENLNIEIVGDETVEVTAEVVFNGTDDYAEGDEVFLTFNAVTEAEDANGNDEGDIAGSNPSDFSSDTFTLRSEGVVLELTSVSEALTTKTVSSSDIEVGTYVFKFDVTAFGEHFYMDEDAANVDYDLLVDGVAAASASSSVTLDIADADDAVTADYKISKGETAALTLTVKTADDVTGGSVKVRVNSVAYSAADDATEELSESAVPTNDWTSESLILN